MNDPVDNEKEVNYGFDSNSSVTTKESKYSVDEEAMIGYFENFFIKYLILTILKF